MVIVASKASPEGKTTQPPHVPASEERSPGLTYLGTPRDVAAQPGAKAMKRAINSNTHTPLFAFTISKPSLVRRRPSPPFVSAMPYRRAYTAVRTTPLWDVGPTTAAVARAEELTGALAAPTIVLERTMASRGRTCS